MKRIRPLALCFLSVTLSLALLWSLGAHIPGGTQDGIGGSILVLREAVNWEDSQDDAWGGSGAQSLPQVWLKEKAIFDLTRVFSTRIPVSLQGCFSRQSFPEMESPIQVRSFGCGTNNEEQLGSIIPEVFGRELECQEDRNPWPPPVKQSWMPEKSESLFLRTYLPGLKALSRIKTKTKIRTKLERAAIELGLCPYLAVAMGEVESGYNPTAVSPNGAIGVLQLMPRFFCEDFEINPEMLYDPDVNIRVGLTYMKSLLERFEENIDLSLAAYNAGPRRVVEAGYMVPPIEQTQTYVKKVKKAMERAGLGLQVSLYWEPWEPSKEGL